jgi:hypothetical protein
MLSSKATSEEFVRIKLLLFGLVGVFIEDMLFAAERFDRRDAFDCRLEYACGAGEEAGEKCSSRPDGCRE